MSVSENIGVILRRVLSHPLMKSQDPENPNSIHYRRKMIERKPILRKVYEHWYNDIKNALPNTDGPILEIGSGAGFLKQHIPELIRSDISLIDGVDGIIDACHLPFADSSLRAIVLVDVFHHIKEPEKFLAEAQRCLKNNGALIMLEPWITKWSKYIYKNMHQEALDLNRVNWDLPPVGALSDANVALPWIVFDRDKSKFTERFPYFRIEHRELMMPFSYIISGGITLRSLAPSWSASFWISLDKVLSFFHKYLAMFCIVVVTRVES